MRLTKLALRGLTVYGGDVSISFDGLGDLVAITGPNGSGKTSLLEAVCASLYRTFPTRPGWYDHFRGTDAYIETTWDDHSATWTARVLVDAERSRTERYLLRNGVPATNGKAAEMDAEVIKHFGSLSLFLSAPFAAQNKAGSFLLMPKSERKALFIELLALGRLSELHDAAATKRAEAQKCAGDLTVKRDVAMAASTKVPEHREAVNRARNAERKAHDALYQARSAEHDAIALDAMLQAKREAQRLGREAQDRDEAELMAARAALVTADAARVRTATRTTETLKALDEREVTLRELVARRGDVEQAEAMIPEWETETRALAAAAGRVVEQGGIVSTLDAKLDNAGRVLRSLELQTALLGKVPCTDASAWIRPDTLKTVPLAGNCALLSAAREADVKIPAARAERDRLDAELLAAEEELRKRKESVNEARRTELEGLLDQARKTAAQRPAIDAATGELEALPAKRSKLTADADTDMVAALKAQTDAGERAGTIEARIKDRVIYHAPATADPQPQPLDTIRTALASAEKDYTAAVKAHGAAQAALDEAENQDRIACCLSDDLVQANREVSEWSVLETALGKDGVQALEIDAAGPEVARLTNELLDSCFGHRFSIRFDTLREKKSARGEYSEAFDVIVLDRGHERPVEALSGGERVILGEAIGLAIAVYNGRKGRVRYETLIRDETASALDPDNGIRYTDMLRRALPLGGFSQVLYVAHMPALSERADTRLVIDEHRKVAIA